MITEWEQRQEKEFINESLKALIKTKFPAYEYVEFYRKDDLQYTVIVKNNCGIHVGFYVYKDYLTLE